MGLKERVLVSDHSLMHSTALSMGVSKNASWYQITASTVMDFTPERVSKNASWYQITAANITVPATAQVSKNASWYQITASAST